MVLATASSIPRECTDEIHRFLKCILFFYNSIVALDKTINLFPKNDHTKTSEKEKKKDQIKCRIYIVCFSTIQLLIKDFERTVRAAAPL